MAEEQKTKLTIGHVLFMDVVGYSKLLTEEQSEILAKLNRVVRAAGAVRESEAAGELVILPTGDGMALVFRGSVEDPVECALQVTEALKASPDLPVRIGIHSGPVNYIADVNQRENIAGAGINMAQRVMDCGDAGHILLSKRVADDLAQYRRWQPYLHDLGDCEVKHGVLLSLVNFYAERIGNSSNPTKLTSTTGKAVPLTKSRRSPLLLIIGLISLIVLTVPVIIFLPAILKQRRPGSASPPASIAPAMNPIVEKSIAVLPFENLSDDKANAYFVAGMQDEILTALAKVSALKVISKTSTEKYSSRPDSLKAIAQELGVTAILEGSVQRAGEAVHINVQLINGRDDTHVWAESYDRELKKVFEVEREVAETVAGKLKAQLSPQDTKELSRVPTANPEAYDRYLRGDYAKTEVQKGRASSFKPAIELLKEAIALDPQFALAYVSLADAELTAASMEGLPAQMIADGRAHLAKALELQPDLIKAQLYQANLYWYFDHDPARALAAVEPLLSRAPNDPFVWQTMAHAKGALGDWRGQLDAIKRAIELDPRNTGSLFGLGVVNISLRRYREGIETLIHVGAIEPEIWVARLNLAAALMYSDRLPEARDELQKWPDPKLENRITDSKYALLAQLEVWNRNYDAALALTNKVPDIPNRLPSIMIPVGNIQRNTDLGFIQLYRGDKANAEQAFTAAQTELEGLRTANADNADFYRDESFILAGLGQHAEAVEAARKATTLSKEDDFVFYLSEIYAHFGDADLAFETMQKLINKPDAGGELCAAALRRDPIWDPVRKDPRFQKAISALDAKEVK